MSSAVGESRVFDSRVSSWSRSTEMFSGIAVDVILPPVCGKCRLVVFRRESCLSCCLAFVIEEKRNESFTNHFPRNSDQRIGTAMTCVQSHATSPSFHPTSCTFSSPFKNCFTKTKTSKWLHPNLVPPPLLQATHSPTHPTTPSLPSTPSNQTKAPCCANFPSGPN